ncbi:MAG: hypothetical protein ABS68_13730 [Niastella sp. SCN 39-18]|nr:hypothetical protein [Sphingobacteriales bacterium]ODT50418.1 MAG: hypothetical protein ABS68_13730 [Niastella sp. SCN 39-18]
MKKILFMAAMIACTGIYAQDKKTSILLNPNQVITINSQSTQKANMGMGMETNSNNTTVVESKVTALGKDNYTIHSKIKRMVIEADMMGNHSSFDSDKKEDLESDMGKAIAPLLEEDMVATLDKNSGEWKAEKKAEENKEENPLEEMMTAISGSSPQGLSGGIYFQLPADFKVGTTWSESKSVKDIKSTTNYTVKSVTDNIVVVGYTSTMVGTTQTEMQGMQVDVDIDSKSSGEITVDSKTSLVKKKSSKDDINSTLNMGGQSMPITTSVETTTSFQ